MVPPGAHADDLAAAALGHEAAPSGRKARPHGTSRSSASTTGSAEPGRPRRTGGGPVEAGPRCRGRLGRTPAAGEAEEADARGSRGRRRSRPEHQERARRGRPEPGSTAAGAGGRLVIPRRYVGPARSRQHASGHGGRAQGAQGEQARACRRRRAATSGRGTSSPRRRPQCRHDGSRRSGRGPGAQAADRVRRQRPVADARPSAATGSYVVRAPVVVQERHHPAAGHGRRPNTTPARRPRARRRRRRRRDRPRGGREPVAARRVGTGGARAAGPSSGATPRRAVGPRRPRRGRPRPSPGGVGTGTTPTRRPERPEPGEQGGARSGAGRRGPSVGPRGRSMGGAWARRPARGVPREVGRPGDDTPVPPGEPWQHGPAGPSLPPAISGLGGPAPYTSACGPLRRADIARPHPPARSPVGGAPSVRLRPERRVWRESGARTTDRADEPSGAAASRACPHASAPDQGATGHGRRHDEAAARERRALRAPDPPLEPEDEAIHLQRAQRHLHHRPAAVADLHRPRLRVRARDRRPRRLGHVHRHQAPGAGAGRPAGDPRGHALRQPALARRHADQLQHRAQAAPAPQGARAHRLRRRRGLRS